VRLVARVHVAEAALLAEPLGVLARVVEVAAVEDELRAEPAHRRDLDGVRALGDADRGRHAEEARRVPDRLAVVPGRGGDHAARPLLRPELRDEVDSAAHLERADRLVVLVLDVDLRADELVERRVAVERRRPQVRRDAAPRVEHVREGELRQRRHDRPGATAWAA
jgi:hypothetical protein